MIDPDLQKQLESINANVVKLQRGTSVWRSFFNGMFGALGYLIGLIIVIVAVGWFLNKTGQLAAFQNQAKQFQVFMNQVERLMSSGQQGAQPPGR